MADILAPLFGLRGFGAFDLDTYRAVFLVHMNDFLFDPGSFLTSDVFKRKDDDFVAGLEDAGGAAVEAYFTSAGFAWNSVSFPMGGVGHVIDMDQLERKNACGVH